MIYLLISQFVSLLLDLFALSQRSERHKDLEILLLRQQLRIMQRQHPTAPRISRGEKLALAVLTAKLTALGQGAKAKLDQVLFLFKPATVLKWHHDLVGRKWSFKQQPFVPRRHSDPKLVDLLLRLAQENPAWGYSRLQGELLKLGYKIGRSTVRDILKRRHVPPAPERANADSNWRSFLGHYADQLLACDFFTVETAWLRTLYVFFFIELGSRQVHCAGCTAHPTAEWGCQQARQLTWTLQGEQKSMRFLIHDRDAKFTSRFEAVFAAEGSEIVRTPFRAPKANAFAERWIRSVRAEILDRVLVLGESHLQWVIKAYIEYYNQARPHQGIEQRCPVPIDRGRTAGVVKRRDVLGGIIHDYTREAA
jgi:transposase InsO family protein